MARSKSAVLSPADKKAVVTDLKTKIKEAKAADKLITTTLKEAEKVFKAAEKSFAGATKEADKALSANAKIVSKLEADLEAIQPAVQ